MGNPWGAQRMDLTQFNCVRLPGPFPRRETLAGPPGYLKSAHARGKGGFGNWGVLSAFPAQLELLGPWGRFGGGGEGYIHFHLKGGVYTVFFPQKYWGEK
eukprot:FR738775.1.p2 GENE.FR738775.1~~FR738775.1.p2  ORF type:complete len:100 (+),score=30.82 FR738775.1:869-1168(+)